MRSDVAQICGVELGRLLAQVAHLQSRDFTCRGIPARAVLAASRLQDRQTAGGRRPVVCFADARPILLPISPIFCIDGVLDTHALALRYSHRCPAGWEVCLRRVNLNREVTEQRISASAGEVFIVLFRQLSGRDTFLPPLPPRPRDSDEEDDQDTPARDSSHPGTPSTGYPVPQSATADTGGTSSPLPVPVRESQGRQINLRSVAIQDCAVTCIRFNILRFLSNVVMWRAGNTSQDVRVADHRPLTSDTLDRCLRVDPNSALLGRLLKLAGCLDVKCGDHRLPILITGECNSSPYSSHRRGMPSLSLPGSFVTPSVADWRKVTSTPYAAGGSPGGGNGTIFHTGATASGPPARDSTHGEHNDGGQDAADTPSRDLTAVPGCEEGFGTRVPFAIFSQEYQPECVVARLVLPARVREAFAVLAQSRVAHSHRRCPRFLAVFPQPFSSFACVLAVPQWDYEGVPVLVVCKVGRVRAFCMLLPHWVPREDFLQSVGIPIDRECYVFIRDVPRPLQPGAYIYPQIGDLVYICEHQADLEPRLELFQMLEPTHPWDLSDGTPTLEEDINWVLSVGTHVALPIAGDSFALNSAQTATALGLEAGQFILVPASPAILDHAHLGIGSQRVLAACSAADISFGSEAQRVPYILDQRPVLLQIYLAYAPDGLLDVEGICHRLSWLCPNRHHVRLLGGRTVSGSGSGLRRVEAGDVITVEFHPDYLRDVFTEQHADSFTLNPAGPEGDTRRPAAQHSGPQADSAEQAGGRHGGSFSSSGVSRTNSQRQAHDYGPFSFLWTKVLPAVLLSTPCRLLAVIAVLTAEVQGVHFDPRDRSFEWPHQDGAGAAVPGCRRDTEGLQHGTELRHLPEDRLSVFNIATPCRGLSRGHEIALQPIADIALVVGECRTLLEESAADPTCQAFWLAATLLETLEEHIQSQVSGAPQEGLTEGSPPVCLRLAEHLPPTLSVDLSHVSLPLRQSLDHVIGWTLPGSWCLPTHIPAGLSLHPAARELLDKCSLGDPEECQHITVFTDGSFGNGVSSWAFVVLGTHSSRQYFLGWAAGRVPTDRADPLFICPCDSHALSGEQTALLWSAIWAIQSPRHTPARVFCDCLVALSQAQGNYGWSAGEELAPLCRAAFQALAVARPAWDSVIHHVRSHQGCPANELADALAKYAGRASCTSPCAHQVWAAEWIRAGTLPWLWVQLEAVKDPECWPQQVGSTLVDTQRHSDSLPLQPQECYKVLGLPEQDSEDQFHPVQFSLRIMSVNVQSLTDPDAATADPSPETGFTGRARYLREQFTHMQVHVSALQESRAKVDATYVSDTHIRYCTACDTGGNFGCELWFSRLLPFVWRQHNFGHFHPNDFLAISFKPS